MDQSYNMDHRHNSLDIAASEVKLATFDALANSPATHCPLNSECTAAFVSVATIFVILSQFDEDF